VVARGKRSKKHTDKLHFSQVSRVVTNEGDLVEELKTSGSDLFFPLLIDAVSSA